MKSRLADCVGRAPLDRASACAKSGHGFHGKKSAEQGFTLIELLIVTTVIPIIIGALAAGLFAMFSLQSSVSNRLSDSADSQVVQASYRNDVQSALLITTASASTPQCGSGFQLLGLAWDENLTTHKYQTYVSYFSVPVTSSSGTTYSLVRQLCNWTLVSGVPTLTPVTTTTVASDLDLATSKTPAQAHCNSATITAGTCDVTSTWMDARGILTVNLPITEPSSNYQYTLVAAPATNASATDTGGPITVNTTAGCGYAAVGSGTYATSLCLVDLSGLTGNNMLAATQAAGGCLEVSVPLPGGATMYFCIHISGAPVAPYALPTWPGSFLGNSINGLPFYSDVPGNPALYQSCEGGNVLTTLVSGTSINQCYVGNPSSAPYGDTFTGTGTTTVSITGITVVAPNGKPATGWEFVSADAESSDFGESLTWTTGPASSTNLAPPLYLIPNAQVSGQPVGSACETGANLSPASLLTGGGSTTVVCTGYTYYDSHGNQLVKTGTVMVEALTPTSLTTTMVGTGLEGAVFGLLF